MGRMNRGVWSVAVVIIVLGAPIVSISQTTSSAKGPPPPAPAHTAVDGTPPPPDPRHSCRKGSWTAWRIVSGMGIAEFRVPLFTPITKRVDADYVVYGIRYRVHANDLWLNVALGPLVGGGSPH